MAEDKDKSMMQKLTDMLTKPYRDVKANIDKGNTPEALQEYRDMQPGAKKKEKKKAGGTVKMKSGGYVKAADGCAKRGKTKGRMV